jgi:hypothetical protein
MGHGQETGPSAGKKIAPARVKIALAGKKLL